MVMGIRTTVDSIVSMVGLLVRGGVRIICVGSARMSRKDYVAVSRVLRARRDDSVVARDVVDRVAHELCETFASNSDSFDRERFLSACGVRT